MDKLILSVRYKNISVRYRDTQKEWIEQNAIFKIESSEIKHELNGVLHLWCPIELDELKIKESWNKLKDRSDRFYWGLRYQRNFDLERIEPEVVKYVIGCDGREFVFPDQGHIGLLTEIIAKHKKGGNHSYAFLTMPALKVTGVISSPPASFPDKMPDIASENVRILLTYLQGLYFDRSDLPFRYDDEQIKRWFLLMEELPGSRRKFNDIKAVRDFVSHEACDENKHLIEMVRKEIGPHAVLKRKCKKGNDKEYVKFDRSDSQHLSFVSKYQATAREIIQGLIAQKLMFD